MISRRLFCATSLLVPIVSFGPSRAFAANNDIQLMAATVTRITEGPSSGFYLAVDWEFDLPDALNQSLSRGIALYFSYEFQLSKKRWYWLDREIATATLLQRLSYSPLSRQFRFSQGGLTQTFDSLDQALPLLKHVRDWRVCDLNKIGNVEDYEVETRMRLDLSRLPKPLQVTVGGNSDWALNSEWESVPLSADLINP